MPRRLDDQTKETIYQLYGDGKSADDIAAQIGIGKSTVWAYIAKRKKEIDLRPGLPKSPDRSRKLTADQIDEIIDLYEGGVSITEIARRFGVHDSTLHYHLNEYGVKKRKPQNDQPDLSTSKAVTTDDSTAKKKRTIPPKRTDVTDEMVRRWTVAVKLLGCSVADIAREEGFSHGLIFGRINSYLRKHPHVIEEEIEARSNRMGRTNKPSIDDQMDDPEMAAAAATEPAPVRVDTEHLARQRARELHQRAQVKAQGSIVSVEGLPLPFARKQSNPPRGTAFGESLVVGTVNAMPVAQMVGKLVDELNTIPGVKASFSFSYHMSAGA